MSHKATILDRSGILASVFCAIHCAVAPVLILAAPVLGEAWSHPLSHLAIAAFVLPVGVIALRGGYRQHGLRWVLALGLLGIAFVLIGAVLPYFAPVGRGEVPHDACCPSFSADADTGERVLNIPPASIATLVGGVFLILAHVANLRCCSRCRETP